jgi:hypothetical protein
LLLQQNSWQVTAHSSLHIADGGAETCTGCKRMLVLGIHNHSQLFTVIHSFLNLISVALFDLEKHWMILGDRISFFGYVSLGVSRLFNVIQGYSWF